MGWRKFLEKNLNPNTPVDNGAPVGLYTVMVQFVVDKEGKVSDIKALTQIGYGMEQEVIRIMRQSGAWEPAMVGGEPVAAYRKQPVIFMVQEDGFDITLDPEFTLPIWYSCIQIAPDNRGVNKVFHLVRFSQIS